MDKKEYQMVQLPPFGEALTRWYRQHKRDLPWRKSPTPYEVWVSEIMLQQTRAEAVKPYYRRFLEALPDVYALAAVEEDVLNKLWQGLGYYSRARNLKKGAEAIVNRFAGRIPENYQDLLTLPGVGSYTAGAIASIGFGEAVPAVDGNVLRVLSRLTGDGRNILDPKVKGDYERYLAPYIPKESPGDFNQGLIELGATLCGPNTAPKCEECPLQHICVAKRDGLQNALPLREKKKPRSVEKRTVLLLCSPGKILLRKRGESGLLAGLYEFPAIEGEPTPNQVLEWLEKQGFTPKTVEETPKCKHIFTHKEWHMEGLYIPVGEEIRPSDTYVWATFEEIEAVYSVPSAFAGFISFLKERGLFKHET